MRTSSGLASASFTGREAHPESILAYSLTCLTKKMLKDKGYSLKKIVKSISRLDEVPRMIILKLNDCTYVVAARSSLRRGHG